MSVVAGYVVGMETSHTVKITGENKGIVIVKEWNKQATATDMSFLISHSRPQQQPGGKTT